MCSDLNEQVRRKLPDAMADHIDKIPLSIRHDLVSETSEFFEAYHITPALVERFSPRMDDMTPLQIFRDILPDNLFKKTRCQPLVGHLAAVSSVRHPRFCFYPYLPLSYFLAPQRTAPLIVLARELGVHRGSPARELRFQPVSQREKLTEMTASDGGVR